jgi:DNA replication protein DnaD
MKWKKENNIKSLNDPNIKNEQMDTHNHHSHHNSHKHKDKFSNNGIKSDED